MRRDGDGRLLNGAEDVHGDLVVLLLYGLKRGLPLGPVLGELAGGHMGELVGEDLGDVDERELAGDLHQRTLVGIRAEGCAAAHGDAGVVSDVRDDLRVVLFSGVELSEGQRHDRRGVVDERGGETADLLEALERRVGLPQHGADLAFCDTVDGWPVQDQVEELVADACEGFGLLSHAAGGSGLCIDGPAGQFVDVHGAAPFRMCRAGEAAPARLCCVTA